MREAFEGAVLSMQYNNQPTTLQKKYRVKNGRLIHRLVLLLMLISTWISRTTSKLVLSEIESLEERGCKSK